MKYERLTRRNADGTTWVKCAVCDIQDKCDFTKESCCQELQDRLAELEDKIENGTLIELPCKVGDTVYFAVNNGWDCAEIDEIHIFKDDIVFEWVQYDRGYELTELWDCGDFSLKDIGKTVFLTREEAEKRLKELQNG